MTRPPFEPPKKVRASCAVSMQALCFGEIETSVFGVAGAAARPGEHAHIGIRYGRVLVYIEDRIALERLADAVGQAMEMARAVFPEVPDAIALAEIKARRRFERTGNVTTLR
jgi:hypothetical protein